MAVTQVAPTGRARTKLPYFDLVTHSEADEKQTIQQHHSSLSHACPIATTTTDIIKGFAAFVAAVTDLEDISFVAKHGAEDGSVIEPFLATVSLPSSSAPRSFQSDHIQILKQTLQDDGTNDVDFEIEISSGDLLPEPQNTSRVSYTCFYMLPPRSNLSSAIGVLLGCEAH